MNAIELTEHYKDRIKAGLNNTLTVTSLPVKSKRTGKVRDQYDFGDRVALITTDRQSAFDRILASIPFKGQVLNLTSAWWFEQTKNIIPNHVIDVPDPNVTLAKKCTVFPIEFVVRGYITGSTSTSLWTVYNNGNRKYCGNILPEGLMKNQKLEANMLTPTTKEENHDRPISSSEIVNEGWMTQEDWDYCSTKALDLFAFGQKKAAEHGLVLVDTKYEMGRDSDGNIMLIDEIHTPDSSRYWIAETYEERFAMGREPQNIDKEFLRLWFVDNCDPYNDETLPEAPEELVVELSSRYIYLYETITGNLFPFPDSNKSVQERIVENLNSYF
ncbi:MAG TPA: phosphoribosylaminoimidazolesuccinocarboxamide synthase [Bacteroidetes bacterium]|nr:phosphoribosylaminoimidazolesuccinocarboxamide synthase [Bacteroidota bacterium]